MSIFESLTFVQKQLMLQKIPSSRLEAELLLCHALQMNRAGLHTKSKQVLTIEQNQKIAELVSLRLQGMPMAYILGEKEFFSLPLLVSQAVLIPRPETELLVEQALQELVYLQAEIFPQQTLFVVDVGTGSGAIALALKTHHISAFVLAIDKSKEALCMAQKNAATLQIPISFLQSNLLHGLLEQSCHMIVSNPPYIPTSEIKHLQKEVRQEPHLALDGGEDGLTLIRILIKQAFSGLRSQGVLLLEIGFGQAKEVEDLLKEAGFIQIQTHLDFAQIPRVLVGRKPG